MLFLNKLTELTGAALSPLTGARPVRDGPGSALWGPGDVGLPQCLAWLCERVLAMLLDPGAGRRLLSGNMEQTRELMFNSCSELR